MKQPCSSSGKNVIRGVPNSSMGVINNKIGSNCNQWVTTQADHPLNGLVLNVSWRTLIIKTISQLE